jgi:hypothetical protein
MIDDVIGANERLVVNPAVDDLPRPTITRYLEKTEEYPIRHQHALIDTMEDNSILALRSRPSGAHEYDGIIEQKPQTVSDKMIAYKYDDGRRLIYHRGRLRTVVSDTDLADIVVDRVPERVWTDNEYTTAPGGFAERFYERYGAPGVQHGPLSRGLTMRDVIDKLGDYRQGDYQHPERIINFFKKEEVYVFVKNSNYVGFFDKMPLYQYLRDYNEEALEKIRTALPKKIWDKIIE